MSLDVPAPKPFLVSTDPPTAGNRWKKWIEGFQIYLVAANITKGARKKALLLHIGGEEIREIFDPLTVADDTPASAIKALNKYFLPM